MITLQDSINAKLDNLLNGNAYIKNTTLSDFETICKDWKGNKTVTLLQLTSQATKLKAASAKENEVLSLTECTVLVGTSTNVRVNNQLEREGKEANYEALPTYMDLVSPALGQNIKNPKQKYFVTYPFDNSHPKTETFLNGVKVKKDEILHLYKPSSLKDYSSKVQGTEKKIQHMRPKLESLLAVKVDNTIYLLK